MIKQETINGLVFVEQTRYYIYASEEARQRDEFTLSTSDPEDFERNKRLARDKASAGDPCNQFIVL